ncbi:hypothetical protein HG537_0C03050 [Torulaspora globosa]|uniref:AD domain-containing protein n=1 Tax=Torulaspora globosa TaxID=48254 RepID=A0A7H9HSJ5_9SACH|nr:hypothetical protein HG537_0C03050 [Torulaspora sp. CBS 2947]
MSISLENILGFKVRVTNVLDEVTEGKVYSFNSSNSTLTLQTNKKNQPASFKIIKCSFIKSLEVSGEKPASNAFKRQHIKPTYVDVQGIDQALKSKIAQREKTRVLIGKGVSKEGQFLFDLLYKTVSDTRWVDKAIVVLDDVQVVPPYRVEDIKSDNGTNSQSVALVQKIIERGWEKLENDSETNGRKGG